MTRSAPLAARVSLALFSTLALCFTAPANATPAQPALTNPTPAQSALTNPTPAQPALTNPTPAQPAPAPRAARSHGPGNGLFTGGAPASSSLGAPTGLALLALLSLGALAWWRRRRLPAELASSAIEIVAQASLGGRARVMWLRTAGPSSSRNLVVTVTPQAVQVIDRWPDALEAAATSVEPAQIQRARRPTRVRTLPPTLTARASAPSAASTPSAASAPNAASASARPAPSADEPIDPRGDSRSTAFSAHPSDRARPRWDTATHRVIEDRARHLEAAFTGESTFEGIPDDLAADLAADLPLLPDEPGAAKPPSRTSAELLARAWRRTISRQPAEAPNAAAQRPPAPAAGDGRDVRFSDDKPRALPTYESSRPPRAARGSIGHAAATVRPPAASPSSRRPILRTELRAKRPASARCRLPFRRRDEEDPQ